MNITILELINKTLELENKVKILEKVNENVFTCFLLLLSVLIFAWIVIGTEIMKK